MRAVDGSQDQYRSAIAVKLRRRRRDRVLKPYDASDFPSYRPHRRFRMEEDASDVHITVERSMQGPSLKVNTDQRTPCRLAVLKVE
jgi:hypothetical protein